MNRLALFLSLVAALFAAACGGSGSVVTPPPPVGGFTTASLKGQYAFSMSGSDVSGAFFARIGSFIADGNGNITSGVEDVNIPGSPTQTIPYTASTYSVQADGRGTVNLTNSTGTTSFTVTLLFLERILMVKTVTTLNATVSVASYMEFATVFNSSARFVN